MRRDGIELVVSFDIVDYARWERVARACVEHVAAQEPGTLRYDWYVDGDRVHGRLFEAYVSPEALREHVTGPVFTEIGPGFGKSISWRSVEAFGPVPQELFDILRGLPIHAWRAPTLSHR